VQFVYVSIIANGSLYLHCKCLGWFTVRLWVHEDAKTFCLDHWAFRNNYCPVAVLDNSGFKQYNRRAMTSSNSSCISNKYIFSLDFVTVVGLMHLHFIRSLYADSNLKRNSLAEQCRIPIYQFMRPGSVSLKAMMICWRQQLLYRKTYIWSCGNYQRPVCFRLPSPLSTWSNNFLTCTCTSERDIDRERERVT